MRKKKEVRIPLHINLTSHAGTNVITLIVYPDGLDDAINWFLKGKAVANDGMEPVVKEVNQVDSNKTILSSQDIPPHMIIPPAILHQYLLDNLGDKLKPMVNQMLSEGYMAWAIKSGLLNQPAGGMEHVVNWILKPDKDAIKQRIGAPRRSRPKGTGMFKDTDEFLIALRDVLSSFSRRPSEKQVISKLRRHHFARQTRKEASAMDETKTLRNWLKRSGLNFDEAVRIYFQPNERKINPAD